MDDESQRVLKSAERMAMSDQYKAYIALFCGIMLFALSGITLIDLSLWPLGLLNLSAAVALFIVAGRSLSAAPVTYELHTTHLVVIKPKSRLVVKLAEIRSLCLRDALSNAFSAGGPIASSYAVDGAGLVSAVTVDGRTVTFGPIKDPASWVGAIVESGMSIGVTISVDEESLSRFQGDPWHA